MPGGRYANLNGVGAGLGAAVGAQLMGQQPPRPQQVAILINFDGHEFPVPAMQMGERVQVDLSLAPIYEMAYRARRGDEAAAATLSAFGIGLVSKDRVQYWPPTVETEAPTTETSPLPQAEVSIIEPPPSEPSNILLPPGV